MLGNQDNLNSCLISQVLIALVQVTAASVYIPIVKGGQEKVVSVCSLHSHASSCKGEPQLRVPEFLSISTL